MKYIIIDDNTKFTESLLVELKEEGEVISSEGYVLNELANEIQVRSKNESDTVLLININLKAKNSNRQAQKGIELLIWLRIKGLINHIVLYSFETLHSLLKRNPKHLIATSQGTTFAQLPHDFKKMNFEDIKKERAKSQNIRQLLKSFFSVDEFRHKEANLWGIKCLWDAHKKIDITFADEYPSKIKSEFDTINSAVIPAIYFKADYSKGFPNQSLIQKINYQLNELHSLYPIPNIILIDDQAKDGWSNIISKIVYGKQSSTAIEKTFNIISPIKSDTINTIFQQYLKILKSNIENGKFIDLIIMDLRLFDEIGVRRDVFNLSGIKLFEKIRSRNPNIPILVITASNKVNAFSFLYEMKDVAPPNGFWIKEGIDFHNYENDKLHNHLLLSTQLNKLIQQKRRSRYVNALNLQSFNTEQSKIKALEIVNNGFPEVVLQCDSIQFDSYIQKAFNHKYCIIDTNIFIKSNLEELFDYSQTVILLSALRNQTGVGKIGIHINVFAEILKFGMAANDDLINLVARKTHKNLQQLYSKEQLEVIIPNAYLNNPKKLEVVITGLNPYADDALFSKSKELIEKNNSLLFISDDKKDDGTAKQIVAFLSKKPQFKQNVSIIDGKEMVLRFRRYIEKFLSPNSS